MNYDEIVKGLRSNKVETGSLVCLGCGHEHDCGIYGCAIMRTAADAIENLQTENAALRRQIDNLTSAQAVMVKEFDKKLEELAQVKAERTWISVKDRLPDATFCVLVHYDDGNVLVDAVGSDGEWMDEDFSGGNITHWMPLPEPPEKEA